MKKTLVIFVCSLYIAASALLSFPAVSWFDRWSVGIAGFIIVLLSFSELRKIPLKDHPHDERPLV
jgi:hypothetical protein